MLEIIVVCKRAIFQPEFRFATGFLYMNMWRLVAFVAEKVKPIAIPAEYCRH